jgi:non-specific serine/threonine protein kinase
MRARWLERLEREHDNLRAALRWFTDQQAAEAGLRLGGLLCPFWDARGHLTEGRRWLAELFALTAVRLRTVARAKALLGAGNLAYAQGDHIGAGALWTEGLRIALDVQDKWCIGCYLGSFVALAASQQQPVRALRLAATDAVFQMIGTPLPLATGELAERGRAQATQAVDADTQAAARAECQAMTFAQGAA